MIKKLWRFILASFLLLLGLFLLVSGVMFSFQGVVSAWHQQDSYEIFMDLVALVGLAGILPMGLGYVLFKKGWVLATAIDLEKKYYWLFAALLPGMVIVTTGGSLYRDYLCRGELVEAVWTLHALKNVLVEHYGDDPMWPSRISHIMTEDAVQSLLRSSNVGVTPPQGEHREACKCGFYTIGSVLGVSGGDETVTLIATVNRHACSQIANTTVALKTTDAGKTWLCGQPAATTAPNGVDLKFLPPKCQNRGL